MEGVHLITFDGEGEDLTNGAEIVAQASGQAIDHVQLSEDAERARLVGYGYDPDYVEFGVQLALNPPGDPSVVLSTVEAVTGRPARTFTQWAGENAAAFRTG